MVLTKESDNSDITEKLVSMSKRRGFYWPSFEIYGGIAGFYDYGPLGMLMRNSITDTWRRIYRSEDFYEIDTPTVNPESVFRSSGHLEFFTDYLVDCNSCHESFRADHLVDLAGAPSTPETLSKKLSEEKTRCPRCGSRNFSAPRPFNLMFQTQIGPAGSKTGYLRPETAQGIFMNFQQINRFFREKLPFGVIQTGRGYRNEISPRQGLLRLRELNMLEAELFIDPSEKQWKDFVKIKDVKLNLLPRSGKQTTISADEAVRGGIIGSEVLAYFMCLTHRFMVSVGVDPSRSRFRQHAKDEMAHYSTETWDFEAELSSGWTEVAGVAYRGSYDLSAHIKGSSADLTFFRKSGTERVERKAIVRANRPKLGPVYKEKAKEMALLIEQLSPEDVRGKKSIWIQFNGNRIDVPAEFFSVVETEEKVRGEKFVPHVVEPSMGLDRIFFTVLEHSFSESDGYVVLRLPPRIAPIKAGVFPLLDDSRMTEAALAIHDELLVGGVEPYYDDSGSIGRRYARMDEVGTPYCITVDDVTLKDGTVTVRERDSRKQVRIGRKDLAGSIGRLLSGGRLEDFGSPVEQKEESMGEKEG